MAAEQLTMFEQKQAQATTPKAFSLSLSRTLTASAQRVCDQWLIPVFLEGWMFDPQVTAEKPLLLENEVRQGGRFKFAVRRGGSDIAYSGEYLALNIPHKLVFSWTVSTEPDNGYQVTVQFDETQGKTKMKLGLKLPATLSDQREAIKRQWSARCNALSARFRR